MKKVLKTVLWLIVAAMFVGTFVYLYRHSRPEQKLYETVYATRADLERTTILTGTVEPRDEIQLKPQISGIISEITVEAGDMVHEGDVVARIKVIPDQGQLASALARVETARINLEDARSKHERNTLLLEKKVISREEHETSATTLANAKAELEAARDAYSIVKEGVSQSNASESNTMVRATVTGLVLDVPVKVGSSVIQANTMNDGTTIATVADMNNLIFKGKADETEVGLMKVGTPMHISVGALPGLALDAVIENIAPKGTETNGANTFEIKAALQVPGDVQMRAGYSANATVVLEAVKNAVTIPETVIEWSGDSTYVYVLTDSAAAAYTRTPIVTGLSDGLNIQVLSGVDTVTPLRGNPVMPQLYK